MEIADNCGQCGHNAVLEIPKTLMLRDRNLNKGNPLGTGVRVRGFGSEEREGDGSNEDAEEVGEGVPEGSTGGLEVAEVIGGLFGGAGKERSDGSDGNGVAAEEGVWGQGSEGVEHESEAQTHGHVIRLVCTQPRVSVSVSYLFPFHSFPPPSAPMLLFSSLLLQLRFAYCIILLYCFVYVNFN